MTDQPSRPQPPLSPDDFQAQIGATEAQMARLTAYAATLQKWQKAINLVAGGTLPDLWRRHMLDSAQLVLHLPGPPRPPEKPGILVDLGSGAGFPALVIAALSGPETPVGAWQIHLIESDGRKGAFLAEAARAMGLTVQAGSMVSGAPGDGGADVVIHTARIEAVAPFPTDVVTARALAPLEKLLDMAQPFLQSTRNCGLGLFLKGKTAQEELTDAQKQWTIQATLEPSLTDPEGRIVKVTNLTPK